MKKIYQEIENAFNIMQEKVDLLKKSMDIYKKQNLQTVQHYSDNIALDLLKSREKTYIDFFEMIEKITKNIATKGSVNAYKMLLKEIYENDFLDKRNEKTFYQLMKRDVNSLDISEKMTYSIVSEFYAKNAEVDLKYFEKLLKVLNFLKEACKSKIVNNKKVSTSDLSSDEEKN